jgi:antirestriction protein ArdC
MHLTTPSTFISGCAVSGLRSSTAVTDRDGRGLPIKEKIMGQDKRRAVREGRVDIHAKITDRIIAALEAGVRPWVQPWSTGHCEGRITRPLRHNGEPYSGINVLLLWSETVSRGFRSPMWMTFRQALELGAHVRKGETGSTVVYANRVTKSETADNGDEVEREIPFLKTYTVFNVEQIDDLPEGHSSIAPNVDKPAVNRIAAVDAFFAATGAIIRHGGSKAYYAPGSDMIQMPPIEAFRDVESYYATLAHEEVHWAGASHRLNRDLSRYARDRSERAREELVAELGASFLCADLGIVPELEPRPDHASYLGSWLSVLKNDKRFIFQAAAQAQRAVSYLHDFQISAFRGGA